MVGIFLLLGMSLASIAALMVLSFLAFELFDGSRRVSYSEVLPETTDERDYRELAESAWSTATDLGHLEDAYMQLMSCYLRSEEQVDLYFDLYWDAKNEISDIFGK